MNDALCSEHALNDPFVLFARINENPWERRVIDYLISAAEADENRLNGRRTRRHRAEDQLLPTQIAAFDYRDKVTQLVHAKTV